MLRQIALAALPALAISAASAQTGAPVSTPEFVTMAAQSDQFEIQEGQMAEQKGGTAAVKRFGERMVHDHTKLTESLMASAKKAGMPPMSPPQPNPQQMSMMSQLQNLSGAEFDRTYITQQVEAHRQALALMENYAKTGESPPLRMAAKEATPIIRMHLEMAEKLAK